MWKIRRRRRKMRRRRREMRRRRDLVSWVSGEEGLLASGMWENEASSTLPRHHSDEKNPQLKM